MTSIHRCAIARVTLLSVAAIALPAAAQSNCETLQAQIDSRVRAAGVSNFTLKTMDAAASAPGKVVGTCERGTRKILYVASDGKPPPASIGSAASAAAPAASRPKATAEEPIITECRDGSVSMVGVCPK